MGLEVMVERRGHSAVIRLEGEFDLYATAEVREVADNAIELGHPIFMDLTGVTFLDSSALGTLVRLQKRAKLGGTQLTLCGLPLRLYKIFEVTALLSAFTFLPDLPSLDEVDGARAGVRSPRPGA
jgi:anti-sigma B factor antagonist